MINTAIYTRVSTDEQVIEGDSVRAQEEKLRTYAALKEWRIFSVYADEGFSGKNIVDRPALQRLMDDVRNGKINNVIVYKLDRLTRSIKDLIELSELFDNHHCTFSFLQESIDTSTATGRMFLKLMGILAEFERENLVERIKMGNQRKAKEGFSLCACTASLGYNRENGNRIQEINEDEAAIVRRVFDMYLRDDCSYMQIANILNSEKVPTKYNKKWSASTVKYTLTNPNYVGKIRYAVRDATRYFEADGHHQPIIDETTYYETQAKIGKVKRVSRTKHPKSEVYFCGVVYCHSGDCKYSTHWNHNREKALPNGTLAKYGSYSCKGNQAECDYSKDCNSKYISHSRMERSFEEYLSNYEVLTVSDETKPDAEKCDNSKEIATLTAEIKQIEKKTEEVMSLFMSNTMDYQTYQGMVRLGNERRGELETRRILLQNAEKEKSATVTTADIIANFRENWTALNNEQRQQFVQKFIKKITVHREVQDGKRTGEIIVDEILFNEF